jgi:hypothetical protein
MCGRCRRGGMSWRCRWGGRGVVGEGGEVEVWGCGAVLCDVVGYRTMEILRELDCQNFPKGGRPEMTLDNL